MRRGWFDKPGVWVGDRTLSEQMMGLEPALAEANGKAVLDLGCAEGLIAREFLMAGARSIVGLDYNSDMIQCAEGLGLDPLRARFRCHNLNLIGPDEERECHADIVLALAVFHKLRDPAVSVREWSRFALSLLVIRLPHGSTGEIRSKHWHHNTADIPRILAAQGFDLEQTLAGPRGELVQYYRRLPSASATR
jgi:SAM-dependent methyltransferase